MGASINKQYLHLAGIPILAHTLAVLERTPSIEGIIPIIPADEIPYCREHVVEPAGFKTILEIVPGGKERQNSVMNGLRALAAYAADDDIVVIHDGVRPLVTPDLISQTIALAVEGSGALLAVPAKDTIKVVTDGLVQETPARETLWQAQTPQTFPFAMIWQAHLQAEQAGFMGTDDCSLVEWCGGKVRVVTGDYRNIKITTPEDLVLAEAFLRREHGADS